MDRQTEEILDALAGLSFVAIALALFWLLTI